MSYTPTTWTDGVTKLGPTNLNHLETGLQTAASTADSATTTANAAVPKSTVTTNGDLIYGTGSSTVTRLGVGSTDQVLTVAGGVPTYAAGSKKTLTTTGDLLFASGANTLARLAIGSTGNVLTVAGGVPTWAAPSGGGAELDYVQITSDVTGINVTTEGTATTLITGTSTAYDATKKNIEVYIPRFHPTAGSPNTTIVVLRGSTVIGQHFIHQGDGAGGDNSGCCFTVQDTPSASTFSYVVKAFVDAGTMTVKAGAGGTGALFPAHVRVTKA